MDAMELTPVSHPYSVRGEQLVPVTTWVRVDQLDAVAVAQWRRPSRFLVSGRSWYRNPYVVGGLIVAAAVTGTLVTCVAIALLALVAWVTAHAVQIGTAIAAMVCALVLFFVALARSRMALVHARSAGHCEGRCR